MLFDKFFHKSILKPLIFLIFVNNIAGGINSQILVFVDDIKLSSFVK